MKTIVVTDLTKFKDENPNYCLAGIDVETQECIRPNPCLSKDKVKELKIVLGSLLYGDFTKKKSLNPHNEDSNYSKFKNKGKNIDSLFFVLENSCVDNISSVYSDIGGTHNKRVSYSPNLNCSIITIKIKTDKLSIFRDKFNENKFRAKIEDNDGVIFNFLPLTSLRTQNQIEKWGLTSYNKKLNKFRNVYLRIGLSREYKGYYWMQLNGIFGIK